MACMYPLQNVGVKIFAKRSDGKGQKILILKGGLCYGGSIFPGGEVKLKV